jgi:hypothetical protein
VGVAGTWFLSDEGGMGIDWSLSYFSSTKNLCLNFPIAGTIHLTKTQLTTKKPITPTIMSDINKIKCID